MPDYKQGKIYRLYDDTHFYIGSSCVPLDIRRAEHRRHAKRSPNLKRYKHFNEVGWDKVKIELIKECPCETSAELRKHEDEEIRKHKDKPECLNDVCAVRDKEAVRSYMREYSKKHYEANKEQVLTRQRERYETIKEQLKVKHICSQCGGCYTGKNRVKHERTEKHLKSI